MRNLVVIVVVLFGLVVASSSSFSKEYVISNESLWVEVDSLGAELSRIKNRKTDREYLWQGDPEYWEGQAPNMFPVIVRFRDEIYRSGHETYHLPLLGFAHTSDFEVVKHGSDSITLALRANAQTRGMYPWEFELRITYSLNGNELKHRFDVVNFDQSKMYYTLGGHPGFRLPISDGKKKSDYMLTFSKPLTRTLPLLKNGLMLNEESPFLNNENSLPLDDSRLPNHGMLIKRVSNIEIGIAEKGRPPFVVVNFGNLKNCNLWTPRDAPFVCIEALLSHHDQVDSPLDIDKKTYLSVLESGDAANYYFSMTFF